MKPRLAKPLIAAIAGGVLLAGGALATTPAYADTNGTAVSDEASADPQTSSEAPAQPDPQTSSEAPAQPDPQTSSEAPAQPDPQTSSEAPAQPDPQTSSQPPAPDAKAPTGNFRLNLSSIWIGQSVVFTQNESDYSDPTDANSAITRYIDFGDGSHTTLSPGQSTYTKAYGRSGSFRVVETLTDASGNHSEIAKAVTVTVPGRVTLSTHTVWPGQRFTFKVDRVPSGTNRFEVQWGDGWSSSYSGSNRTITSMFYHYKGSELVVKGNRPLYIRYRNANGYTSWISAGSVTVRQDKWRPVVTITKPANANRVKSWNVIRGTVTDKGSGAPYVYVWLTRVNGHKISCFNGKKWIRIYNEQQYDEKCAVKGTKVVKGKWSLKVPGQAKGDLFIDTSAWDWGDHRGDRSLHVKLTR
ncbi:hypothetical protein [Actinoplanes sp. NPDC020271]|uniref:hypothetical protein n=1 Tax=Actinoplanes sp. NPDC020271 TaxID=3363896 RepID=UPI0037A82D6A